MEPATYVSLFLFLFLIHTYMQAHIYTHTRVNMAAWKALLIIIPYICLVIEGSKSNCFCLVGIYGFGYRSGVVVLALLSIVQNLPERVLLGWQAILLSLAVLNRSFFPFQWGLKL